jgi:hypothetical protein
MDGPSPSANGRRCSAMNRRGERCAATVVNAAGYCVAHDPERPADMRELGRASARARARRSSPARRLPKGQRRSLRDLLRTGLDPEKVVAAVEQSLGGTNESARVAAVKFLADLELWRPDEQAAGWPAGASPAVVYAGMSLCELAELGLSEEEEELALFELLDVVRMEGWPDHLGSSEPPAEVKRWVRDA